MNPRCRYHATAEAASLTYSTGIVSEGHESVGVEGTAPRYDVRRLIRMSAFGEPCSAKKWVCRSQGDRDHGGWARSRLVRREREQHDTPQQPRKISLRDLRPLALRTRCLERGSQDMTPQRGVRLSPRPSSAGAAMYNARPRIRTPRRQRGRTLACTAYLANAMRTRVGVSPTFSWG